MLRFLFRPPSLCLTLLQEKKNLLYMYIYAGAKTLSKKFKSNAVSLFPACNVQFQNRLLENLLSLPSNPKNKGYNSFFEDQVNLVLCLSKFLLEKMMGPTPKGKKIICNNPCVNPSHISKCQFFIQKNLTWSLSFKQQLFNLHFLQLWNKI